MIESITITHHIQKHIIEVLMYTETARFRDLRPARTDTNLFTYHLNSLLKSDMVKKVDGGYQLGAVGMSCVDRVSTENRTVRTQPKIITMLVVQNSDGKVLLQQRNKQPYINEWTLPYGKLHIDDATIQIAAQREASEKLNLNEESIEHAGDCYIRVRSKGVLVSTTLAHVFRLFRDDVAESERIQWVNPHQLGQYRLAPAVEEVVARTFFRDPYFFEEFVVDRD